MDFNPHPPLSAFPFVLLTVTLALELLGVFYAKARRELSTFGPAPAPVILLRIAAVVAPVTYFSGYWGVEFAKSVATEPIALHQGIAKLLLLSLLPSLLFSELRLRQPRNRIIAFCYWCSLLISAGLTAYTSFLGGQLVFEHGAGVALH